MSEQLRCEVEDGVATLTLNRPDRRNALSIELRRELADALDALGADAGVRCTVLTGAGSSFCAGMDITQFGGDAANRAALVESSERLVTALADHPRPTLAAVNGPAVAGGFAIALLCDLRVVAPAATFGFPELARGIPAAYAAARAALPPAVARDLALTGRTIDAREALALGVVSAVGALPAVAVERARQIAGHPPRGVDMVTDWIRRDRGDWRALLALEAEMFRSAL